MQYVRVDRKSQIHETIFKNMAGSGAAAVARGGGGAPAKAKAPAGMPMPSTRFKGARSEAYDNVANHSPPLVQMIRLLPPRAIQFLPLIPAVLGLVSSLAGGAGDDASTGSIKLPHSLVGHVALRCRLCIAPASTTNTGAYCTVPLLLRPPCTEGH